MMTEDTSDLYAKPLKHITDVSSFFRYDEKKKCLIFTGETLEYRVMKRFEAYGLIEVTNTVATTGIADMIINDTYRTNFYLLGKFTMAPTDVTTKTFRGEVYYVFTLYHGDVFMKSSVLFKDKNVLFAAYEEMISRGAVPYYFAYDDLAMLFDQAKPVCDVNLTIDHAILEMICSHLARTQSNLAVQYRHSDMNKPWKFVSIRSVSLAPTGTFARIGGSYFSEGLNAALANPSEENNPIEDLLRA